MQGTCRLCGKTDTLKYSHIIPELCFRPLYDPQHRATEYRLSPRRKTWIQKGIREYLLCGACEGVLNRYETYFANLWYKAGQFPSPFGVRRTLRQIDYHAFKLFHLSILWRASVSSLPQFDTVSLGTRHEGRISKMLLSGSGGGEEDYPFWGFLLIGPSGQVMQDLVTKPDCSSLEGHRVYYLLYAGCEWYFFVSSHSKASLLPGALRANGTMVFHSQSPWESLALSGFMQDLAEERKGGGA